MGLLKRLRLEKQPNLFLLLVSFNKYFTSVLSENNILILLIVFFSSALQNHNVRAKQIGSYFKRYTSVLKCVVIFLCSGICNVSLFANLSVRLMVFTLWLVNLTPPYSKLFILEFPPFLIANKIWALLTKLYKCQNWILCCSRSGRWLVRNVFSSSQKYFFSMRQYGNAYLHCSQSLKT